MNHEAKIRHSMISHLKSVGYPNIPYQRIIDECPAMWNKLKQENLTLPGMTYESFLAHAEGQKDFREIKDALYDAAFNWKRR